MTDITKCLNKFKFDDNCVLSLWFMCTVKCLKFYSQEVLFYLAEPDRGVPITDTALQVAEVLEKDELVEISQASGSKLSCVLETSGKP